jgi:hypothetical protein
MTTDRTTMPLHAFLRGEGRDGRGRRLDEVLVFDDTRIEMVHDFVQWLFPLKARSGAQPDAPVLTDPEIAAIRADAAAQDNLRRATERMLRFYRATDGWLTAHDHNHLRITRIVTSLSLLAGEAPARAFLEAILEREAAAGHPVNARSRAYWASALAGG